MVLDGACAICQWEEFMVATITAVLKTMEILGVKQLVKNIETKRVLKPGIQTTCNKLGRKWTLSFKKLKNENCRLADWHSLLQAK